MSAGLPPVPSPSPQNQPALRLINHFEQSTLMAAVCRPRGPAQPPGRQTPDRGTPGTAMLRGFSVLRRPSTDRPRTIPSSQGPLGRVFVRYVRIARRADHTTYVVFPVLSAAGHTSARCAQAEFAAVNAKLHQAPTRLRARVRRLAYEATWFRTA